MSFEPLDILIACETSGVLRRALRARGHRAYSCDLLPAADGCLTFHYQGDVLEILERHRGWDLMIAHPPCTYLSSSGLHWNGRREGREELTEQALAFVRALMAADVPRIAIENPVGRISTAIRPPDQVLQPYDYGDDASKATCLWLKGLPPLRPTRRIPGRVVADGPYAGQIRWANQTDSGQNRLPPTEDRWAKRSETYPGIAAAMADQWPLAPYYPNAADQLALL